MPKVSVYLPDELYAAARRLELPISTLAQQAIERALQAARTDAWVAAVRARPSRVEHTVDVHAALDRIRDEEFGA